MMLTNYPFNRELVAQRQRERFEHAQRSGRSQRTRASRTTWPATGWTFASWLLGRSTQSGRTPKQATATHPPVTSTPCS